MAPEPQPKTSVDRSSGVVVDNYGTVFQNFLQPPRALKSFIRCAQFRSLVNAATAGFVGRGFVLDRVQDLVAGAESLSGYIVIKGEPGIGKTAIAATLVLRHGYVHHFNIVSANVRTPQQFLESVCAQLIVRYDLPHKTLPPSAGEDGGFLSELLDEAAEAARSRSHLPLVIVVDALDEASVSAGSPGANRLYLPTALPAGVFIIVTTREQDDIRLRSDHQSEIWIRESDPANTEDVRQYIRDFLDRRPEQMARRLAQWHLTAEDLIAQVTERSDGNFMYLVHVLPDLASGRLDLQANGPEEGLALPQGLQGYYDQHWRSMKSSDEAEFSDRQRPVLCFLATALEPVSVSQLCEWTGLGRGAVRDVVRQWREFLNTEPGTPPTYRIYHRSFGEFLDEKEDLAWYQDQISDAGLAQIPGFHPAGPATPARRRRT
jgi:hypothetical protein